MWPLRISTFLPLAASHTFAVLSSLPVASHLPSGLTNAFSKKIENHAAAVALHFIHYNFARIHKTLRITPAMAAGLSDHVWSYEEIVGLSN